MDWLGLSFTLGLTGGSCLAGGWLFIHNLRKARFLLDTPTSKVRSAAQGYVELCGMVAADSQKQTAPLSGTACSWWEYQIEEHRRSGNQNARWHRIERASCEAMIELDDGTGRCLIDTAGAQIIAQTRQVWQGDQRHPRRPGKQHWLGILLSGRKRYRYTEIRFHAYEPLYAIGHFYSQGGGHQLVAAEQLQGVIIRRWKQDYPSLLKRFDHNADGQLDDQEWQAVREAAMAKARVRISQDSILPSRHFMRKPGENLPYLVSSYGEEVLARKLRWKSLAGALLCLGGALATSYVISQQ